MADPALLVARYVRLVPLTVRRSGLRPSRFRPTGNRLTVPPMSPPPSNAIEVHGLTKRYGDVLAVDGIDFAASSGATLGLLGGNGAGKTTTIAMLLGLLLPTSGSIRVLGHDMLHDRFAALARMNFSSPYVSLPQRLTVRENLRVYGHLYNVRGIEKRIAELATELDLGALLDRPAGQLSAGQKTRVALAKSLINRPELLLLDEPTASLDPDTGDLVRSWLERYRADTGCTILLASHNMAEVERLCSHVLMLKQGRVVDQGAPQDLLDRYGRDDLEEVFLDIARDRRTARGSGVQPDAVPA
jgi:ABC-2 type transport system ATP-binding protein